MESFQLVRDIPTKRLTHPHFSNLWLFHDVQMFSRFDFVQNWLHKDLKISVVIKF